MAVRITIEPPLDASVRLGLLGCDLGRVKERDPALDGPLASAEEKVRAGTWQASTPRGRSTGLSGSTDQDAAVVGGAAPARAPGRATAAHQHGRRCVQLVLRRVQLPYGLYDAGAIEPPLTLRRGGPETDTPASARRPCTWRGGPRCSTGAALSATRPRIRPGR